MPGHTLRTAIPFLLVLLLSAAACSSGEPDAEVAAAEALAPPSISGVEPSRLVRLDDAQATELAVQTVRVAASNEPVVVTIPGSVEPSPEAFGVVSAPIAGRIIRIDAHEGEHVRAGETVAVIESMELASLIGDLLEARADADYARQQVERYRPLVERRISARNVLDKAEADLRRAEGFLHAAEARLTAAGVSPSSLQEGAPAARAVVNVVSPTSGSIQEHHIDLGGSVNAYDRIATVVNSSEVLVRGYISPDEARQVRPGDWVAVRLPGGDKQSVGSRVTSVQPAVDSDRRAVMINVRVPTPHQELTPGQSIELSILTATSADAVLVPMAAIVYEGTDATVFVRQDGNTFERRKVTLGRVGEKDAVVTEGLTAGDEVAVSQVFSLKALGRYAQYAD